jgi:hypothetical protein
MMGLVDESPWEDAVRRALREGDQDSLGRLFAEAVQAWGRADASRRWWRVLSAYDSSAVTG